jgi:hypothetical protein
MPLPKLVAAVVCAGILGTQIVIASPMSPDRSWYWPFLPYPMYSRAHTVSDTIVVAQLRASECVSASNETILSERSLGAPLHQLVSLVTTIARAPESDTAAVARERLSGAIEAQYPGRYCAASAWVRTTRVADGATYDLRGPMHRAAAWTLNDAVRK